MELLKIVSPPSGEDENMSRQIEALRDQLGSALRIADQLAGVRVAPVSAETVNEQYIRTMLKLRRYRNRFFANDLFADPGWDILLELYAAALGQFRVSISNVCLGAAVPQTTALRWINQMEEKGLIDRRADPIDGRRQFLMLSDNGLAAMNAYFRTVPAGSSLI